MIYMVEIGKPEEQPEIVIDPIEDPVPQKEPVAPTPAKEPVPA